MPGCGCASVTALPETWERNFPPVRTLCSASARILLMKLHSSVPATNLFCSTLLSRQFLAFPVRLDGDVCQVSEYEVELPPVFLAVLKILDSITL